MKRIVAYDAYGNHRKLPLVERVLAWVWMRLKGK